MCAIILKSMKDVKDIPLTITQGIDITKEMHHDDDVLELLRKNKESGALEGGPKCYFNNKEISTFVCSSPNASITSELLRDMIKMMDSYPIFDRSTGIQPFLLADGHGSRLRYPFIHHVKKSNKPWTVSADFGPGGPTLRSSKLEGGVSAQAPFRLVGIPLSYGLSVTGQYGFSPLLAAERISIGGEHSVRGYFESGAGGDHGIIARTQIGVPLFTTFKEPKTGGGTRFSAIVGHDAGWVWDPASGPNATLLHAANLGLSLSNRRLSGRVTIAKALSSLFGTRPARPELLATLNFSI